MAGRAARRGCADADRHRPRLLVPAVLFEAYGLSLDWPSFLDDFQRHWPTDGDHASVELVRRCSIGSGSARLGSARWRRLDGGRARAREVGVSLRRAWIGGKIHPCWHSVAPLHPPAARQPRAFLAVRRLGHSARQCGRDDRMSRPRSSRAGRSGKQHRVDDVNDPIVGHHVRRHDVRHVGGADLTPVLSLVTVSSTSELRVST